MNDTFNLLTSHQSIRKFQDKAVEEEKLQNIIDAAQWAPTSSHYQAYTIINVKDPKKREAMATFAGSPGNRRLLIETPLLLVFCADLYRSKKFWKNVDPKVYGNTEMFMIATTDAALSAQKAYIAAQSMGLGGVIVGSVRNDLKKMDEILELPELVYSVFGMALGYPAEDPGQKPRLPKDVIYKVDTYDQEGDEERILEYDKLIKDYYTKRSGGKIQDTWGERCGATVMGKTREEVMGFIKGKKFCQR